MTDLFATLSRDESEFLQGCSSLANKAERFKRTLSETPGPGTYYTKKEWQLTQKAATVPLALPQSEDRDKACSVGLPRDSRLFRISSFHCFFRSRLNTVCLSFKNKIKRQFTDNIEWQMPNGSYHVKFIIVVC